MLSVCILKLNFLTFVLLSLIRTHTQFLSIILSLTTLNDSEIYISVLDPFFSAITGKALYQLHIFNWFPYCLLKRLVCPSQSFHLKTNFMVFLSSTFYTDTIVHLAPSLVIFDSFSPLILNKVLFCLTPFGECWLIKLRWFEWLSVSLSFVKLA